MNRVTESAVQLAADLRAGRVTAVGLAEQALARAEAARDRLGAFVVLTEDIALEAARQADRDLAAGNDRGMLHGIPVAVKDVIDVAGVRTANGTAGLGWRLPSRDAAAWAAMRRAGAVLVGKTTTHELAWGATTPGCRNPVDATRSPGGSSGGSAAAVAAGVVPIALGTDTGGSIRLPAALCGVVGFRPATGSVPLSGITPLAPSQDVVGPLGASVADCALVARLLGVRWQPAEPCGRFGVIAGDWVERVEPGVAAAFDAACSRLVGEGLRSAPMRIPLAELAPAASYVTMLAESADAWWNAARDHPEAVGDRVRALLRAGAGIALGDYMRARAVVAAIRGSLCAAMVDSGVDVCALPTVPVTAKPVDVAPEAAYVAFTALASVTGLAAMSVPCGVDGSGLPVGLQLIAAPGREAALWSIAERVETPSNDEEEHERARPSDTCAVCRPQLRARRDSDAGRVAAGGPGLGRRPGG